MRKQLLELAIFSIIYLFIFFLHGWQPPYTRNDYGKRLYWLSTSYRLSFFFLNNNKHCNLSCSDNDKLQLRSRGEITFISYNLYHINQRSLNHRSADILIIKSDTAVFVLSGAFLSITITYSFSLLVEQQYLIYDICFLDNCLKKQRKKTVIPEVEFFLNF